MYQSVVENFSQADHSKSEFLISTINAIDTKIADIEKKKEMVQVSAEFSKFYNFDIQMLRVQANKKAFQQNLEQINRNKKNGTIMSQGISKAQKK